MFGHHHIPCAMYLEFLSLLMLCGSVVPNPPGCTYEVKDPLQPKAVRCENCIPRDLSSNTDDVTLTGISTAINFTESKFAGEGWGNVKRLEINILSYKPFEELCPSIGFEENCFRQMSNLEELRVRCCKCFFRPGVFNGLEILTLLDLSDCTTVGTHGFNELMQPNTTLPKLQTLLLKRFSQHNHTKMSLDTQFWDNIGVRPIAHLDISELPIDTIDYRAFSRNCKRLVHLVTRGTTFGQNMGCYLEYPCKCLQIVDFSDSSSQFCRQIDYFATHPKVGLNRTLNSYLKHASNCTKFNMLFQSDTLIANNVCNLNSMLTFKNITLTFGPELTFWRLKNVHLDQNRIHYLDLQINWIRPELELLSLRNNELVFINPGLFSGLFSLRHIDLSNNNLGVMVSENMTLFEHLLQPMYRLEHVNLKNNRLLDLPREIFSNNLNLKTLDLSENLLTYIRFHMTMLRSLAYLDLRSNQFTTLDGESIAMLPYHVAHIDFRDNTFVCSKCEPDHAYIKWLVDMNYTSNLTCTDMDGHLEMINDTTERRLAKMCEDAAARVRNIVIIAVTMIIVSTACALVVLAVKRYLGQKRHHRHLEETNERIREGNGRFEFVVFLAFCENDEAFVNYTVADPLQNCLADTTGAVRNLVCVGDRELQAGRSVPSGRVELLRRSNVVVFLLSEEFWKADYNVWELELVCVMGKPIVFMIKDDVKVEQMCPLARELYKQGRNVAWRQAQDGRHELTTTWQHVCELILDVVH